MIVSLRHERFWRHAWRARWRIAKYALLFVFAFFSVLMPLWLVLSNSVKPLAEASALSLALPERWQLIGNYRDVFEKGRFLVGLRNTLLIVIPATACIVFLGAAASWIFGRSHRRALTLIYWMCISGALFPPAIVASVRVLQFLGLYGSRTGLVLFYVGVFSSFGIFLITGFIKTIPIELEDAARIDGCGHFGTFRHIILPLLRPVLVTVGFIVVLFMWNDFFFAFFLIKGGENQTLTLGLFRFVSGVIYQTRWNLVFASVAVTSLPLILLFAFVQRYVVAGLLGTTVDK